MGSKIILASSSPRRKELLEKMGLEFEIIPSSYEEDMTEPLPPYELIMKLAKGKAEDVAKRVKSGIVIGVDTFVVFENKKLGKPKDESDAYNALKLISGKNIEVYSGICIIDVELKKEIVDFEVSTVKIKELSDDEINAYIASGEPLDKAGSFAIQGMGSIFIERITGSYSNIVGLPVNKLYSHLKEFGVNIFEYDSWKK